MGQIHLFACSRESAQREEYQTRSKEEIREALLPPAIKAIDGNHKHGPHNITHAERRTGRHDPGSERRSDVCPHNHRNGLRQGQQACVYEGDSHHCSGSTRLYSYCYTKTRQHTRKSITCHGAERMTKFGPSHLLQRIAHRFHPINQQCQSSKHFGNRNPVSFVHYIFICILRYKGTDIVRPARHRNVTKELQNDEDCTMDVQNVKH